MKTVKYYRLNNYDNNVNFVSRDLLVKHLKEFLKNTPDIIEKSFELAFGFCPFDEKGVEEMNKKMVDNLDNLDIDELRILFEDYFYIDEEELILED